MDPEKPRRRLPRDVILAQREQAEEWNASSDRSGEESRVQFLLNRFKLGRRKSSLLQASLERTGHRKLTLALFNEMLPTFPLLMAYAPTAEVSRLHLNEKSSLPALMKRFQDAPFVRAYGRFFAQAEKEANGRAVALLFPRKGNTHGWVIHNGEGLDDYWSPGTKIVYDGGTRDKPAKLVVQLFANLADAIYNNGHGWKPDFAF